MDVVKILFNNAPHIADMVGLNKQETEEQEKIKKAQNMFKKSQNISRTKEYEKDMDM